MDSDSTVACPYCGELTFVAVDPVGGPEQRFVSDCEVCCRPIEFRAAFDTLGRLVIESATEDG